jgi:hypothetical protein
MENEIYVTIATGRPEEPYLKLDLQQLSDGFLETIWDLRSEIAQLKEVQAAQGKLLVGMDSRIKALTALVDHHHTILTKVAGLPPRPKGDPRAN